MARIDVDDYFTDDEGNHYHFHMTDHTQGPQNEVLHRLCRFICDTAISRSDYSWSCFPISLSKYSIYLVSPLSPLFDILDRESRTKHRNNFLIFTRKDNQITITHFGPFGVKKTKNFWNQLWNPVWKEKEKKEGLAKEKKKERKRLEERRKNIDTEFPTTGRSANKPQRYSLYIGYDGFPYVRTPTEEALDELKRKMILKFGELAMREVMLDMAILAGKDIAKSITKGTSKTGVLSVVTKVPLLGFGAGLVFGVWRAAQRDFSGACMELASGTASLVPGAGTAASIGIDAALLGKDVYKNWKEVKEEEAKQRALYEAELRELKAQKHAMISLLEEKIKECKEAEDACNHCVQGCDQLIKLAMEAGAGDGAK